VAVVATLVVATLVVAPLVVAPLVAGPVATFHGMIRFPPSGSVDVPAHDAVLSDIGSASGKHTGKLTGKLTPIVGGSTHAAMFLSTTRFLPFVCMATWPDAATGTEHAAITATWFRTEARSERRLLKRR